MALIRFTVLTRDDGQPVGKTVGLRDGRIATLSSKGAHPTSYEVAECDGAESLMERLRALGPARCILAGVPADGSTCGKIVTKARRQPGALTTGADDWAYPNGPGLLVLDYDPKPAAEGFPDRLRMSPADFGRVVADVAGLPRLAPCVFAPSSGSGLYRTGEAPSATKGFHHYLVVQDAQDIPRAGQALFERLILAGYGWGFATGAGRVETRSLVDSAVWTPNRLFYTGGAGCQDGVLQQRKFACRSGEPLNTKAGEPAAC